MAENVENKKSEAALREEKILEFWRENKTFEKSLQKDSPKGHYVFYDGPPFATGQIHYGHILGSTAKDVIGRYKTMQGYYVPRKWGWDCHGLPIENIVEKELGIAGHVEIEKFGIDKFVEHARSLVLQYDKDWEKGIERIGRWVDFKGSYKTMDNTFIESVWWALSELNKKNLIYEGVKVLAYCARCETPIANSEIAMDNSYKDIADISVYVKFKLKPGQKFGQNKETKDSAYLVAWTTTPWTLPGNTAIAVNKDINYTALRIKGVDELYIIATDCVKNVLKDKEIEIVHDDIKGSDLVGMTYEPVFPYYQDTAMPNKENIWKVWHADFVTIEKGTGIAHEAPAFGEDDMNLAKEHNIPWIIHVDETGKFKDEVVDLKGLKVKPKDTTEDKDAHLRSDIEVIKYLQTSGAYFAKEKIIHSYPHCMRCDTPIIYYALPSWFISITKIKKDIVKQAENINWVPAHLKEGRFKNIVENAPDWNISRNRYWASPLPIWKCDKCKNNIFINSIEDLKDKTKKSGNKYFLMRHGGSIANSKNVDSLVSGEPNDALTDEGREQVKIQAKNFKEKIDMIVSSNFTRTIQTAQVAADILGLDKGKIITNEELREERAVSSRDETSGDIRKRVMSVLESLEREYTGKNILIVSHEFPIRMLLSAHDALSAKEEAVNLELKYTTIQNAEVFECSFALLPRNNFGQVDLHRPYIDEVPMSCDCGGDLKRIPEVLDCWFESGSMPFAQDHYPFENKDWQKNNFPAGFIAEYIAQTRTWFYYTHAVSTMLFNKIAFENVVTTGTLRAEDGEKMSKSKKNYPDPWVFIDKYGVDPLRIYLMSSPLMKGEDANFKEEIVQEIANKLIGRLFNVLAFYELYRDSTLEKDVFELKPKNVLDQWILSRLSEMLNHITKGMDMYDMTESTRPIDLFVDDLSTWYLRRSRDRIKNSDKEAIQTLYFVLKTLAKVMAPFTPFSSEDIWLRLKTVNEAESVHLAEWHAEALASAGEAHIIKDMQSARDLCTMANAQRQKLNIPVRQPLSELKVKSLNLPSEYLELIKDEINVKNVREDKSIENEILLDIDITPELKQEGDYRELVRALQDMRKNLELTPSDIVTFVFDTGDVVKELIEKFENEMKKTILASKIEFKTNDGVEIKIGKFSLKVKIEK